MSAYTTSTRRAFVGEVNHGPASDRRIRHRKQRRDGVYAAAIELFIRQGFDETTIEQIAFRADVSRATVFNYFPRKAAFVDEWAARRRAKAADAVRDDGNEGCPPERVLQRYLLEMARQSDEDRPETVAMINAGSGTGARNHPDLASDIANLLTGLHKSTGAAVGVNAQRTAVLAAACHSAVLGQWISEGPAPFDLAAELLAALDIVLYGIMQPRGGKAETDKVRRRVAIRPRRRRTGSDFKATATTP